MGRVRDRATFDAFAHSRRLRRGAVTLRYVSSDRSDPPRVAYAVGRNVGGAVLRNRARRRLRAAVVDVASELQPGGAYLLGADADAVTMPFGALRDDVHALVRSARQVR